MKHLEHRDHSLADCGNWQLACLAARLLAEAPASLGGIVVRSAQGPALDAWLETVSRLFAGRPVVKIPPHVDDDRLVGGLDLTGTLRDGRPRYTESLLAKADGGLCIIPAAERLDSRKAAMVAACLDRKGLTAPSHDGARWLPARFNVVAIDESLPDEDGIAASLADRLALHVGLDGIGLHDLRLIDESPLPSTSCSPEVGASAAIASQDLEALGRLCEQLGIASQRALMFACRTARLNAACNGRTQVAEEDLIAAVKLVLSSRATRLPVEADHDNAQEQTEPHADCQTPDEVEPRDTTPDIRDQPDRFIDAVKAVLPSQLLDAAQSAQRRAMTRSTGNSGAVQKNRSRGARIGVVQGKPERGARLALHATLLAAAPHQRLRQSRMMQRSGHRRSRVTVLPDDMRIYRRRSRSETLTVFAVDASGSSALHRLAEAKGAVELLLADCYVRRDHVAMIAFRRTSADIVLPPTSAVARARRCLAALPGGGGTPLAMALDNALQLAEVARRRGTEPYLVLLTDGKANIDRHGKPGRTQAMADALESAALFRKSGQRSLLIDTSQRTSPQVAELAQAMHAQYLALPRADAHVIRHAVQLHR